MLVLLLTVFLLKVTLCWINDDSRRSGMFKENHTKIHWFSEGGDMYVTLKDTETLYCFLEVYTRATPDARKFRKLRASLGTVAERDTATLSLVDRHLGKLCQDSVLLTSETEWEYVTNGIDRMRRLVETKVEKKRRRKGRQGGGSKRKKKSTKRCPAKRTPQCSVLHEWHEKHLQYHQVMDAKLLKQVNERPCRCRHNTGTRIPCGSKMCFNNGIQQPCGVRYCDNLVFDFCAESRTECVPEKLLADYVIDNLKR
ncbi:uncharacterized protein LOC134819152 [Bolinopsis microptera]|uniref:uncharacterized protein LOC134819152 n=1 Tax=Bolinopsis microptera TaxID=2820187 RepID=UPI00307A43BF